MKSAVKTPIRRKILISLMFAITLVVSLITFTMAKFFHEDKQAYINDWVSIAAVSTADECRSLLVDYRDRLELYAQVMLNDSIGEDERVSLLQRLFDDLPELVEIAIHRDGKELEIADESNTLTVMGLSDNDLRDYRDTHPLPLDRILNGQVHVDNAPISTQIPSFELAFASTGNGSGSPIVISAILKSDELMRLGSKFRVFEMMVTTSDGTILAHPDSGLLGAAGPAVLRAGAETIQDENQAGLTVEYEANGTEVIAGIASAEIGDIVVTAQIPRSAAYLASRALLSRLMLVAMGLLLTVSVAGLVWAHRITRPLERLSRATRRIAKGEFDVHVEVDSRDEIGALAGSFNQMATELDTREQALQTAQRQLIQSEKMAAFGQLGAGIAHEVKNPLAGVLGCAQLGLLDAEEGSSVHENLLLIEKETQRCKTIIENLLKFARQEGTVLEPTELNRVVEDSVAIVNHQLELQQVRLHTELDPELPMVHGNSNQLQQVLMNLMINAQQAMNGTPGNVIVSTRSDGGHVEVIVRDDGPGIPHEIQAKLFEPFFTTKPTGEGTGLGLSVSYGIVQDHGGEIVVDSLPDEGAAFVIRIPVLTEGMEETTAIEESETRL